MSVNELVAKLRDGCICHPRRWSGDTHADLGGSIKEGETDALMREAADKIEMLEAALQQQGKAVGAVQWLLEGLLLDDEGRFIYSASFIIANIRALTHPPKPVVSDDVNDDALTAAQAKGAIGYVHSNQGQFYIEWFGGNQLPNFAEQFLYTHPPKPVEGWYCPQCKRTVPPVEVTYSEHHESCGTSVGTPPPKPVMKTAVSAGEAYESNSSEEIFTAGIDLPYIRYGKKETWHSKIECHDSKKEGAEALRDTVLAALLDKAIIKTSSEPVVSDAMVLPTIDGHPISTIYAIRLPDGSLALEGPFLLATENLNQANRMAFIRDAKVVAFKLGVKS